MALAAARSLGGKAPNAIAWDSGKSAPPPRPCTTRNVISIVSFCDRPQSSEPNVKSARQSMNSRLMPNRLLKYPEMGITAACARKYPVTTHWMVLRSVLKAFDMGTRATFTIVLSSIAMTRPSAAVNAITYFDLVLTLCAPFCRGQGLPESTDPRPPTPDP